LRHGPTISLPAPDPEIIPLERLVLGGAMDAGLAHLPLPPLRPEEFLLEGHRRVWGAIQELDAVGPRLIFSAVYRALRSSGVEDTEFGGIETLAACTTESADLLTSLTWPAYAAQVRAAATDRMLKALSISAAGGGLSVDELRAKLDRLPGAVMAASDLHGVWRAVEASWTGQRIGFGLDLDQYLGGLLPGDFLVVGARTSNGKTAFTCDRLLSWARLGIPVSLVSLEETREQILKRLVSHATGIALARLREGDHGLEVPLTAAERRRAAEAAEEIAALPLEVVDAAQVGLSVAQVVAACSGLRGQIVAVDYLQQIQSDRDRHSRVYALEEIMGLLKLVADKRRISLWVNAQLNRDAEEADEMGLHHLRDSGSIEQKARRIMLLRWLWKKSKDPADAHAFHVMVLKNSEGPTGQVSLHFDAATGRFDTVSRRDEPDWVHER
jgi:replicative DNA helicase